MSKGDNNTNNLKSFQQLSKHFHWYKCEIFDENKYEWPITEWNNSQESDVLLFKMSKLKYIE
ncbi:hypothetical protein H8356DRAFT_1323428 [Neocallimastix lanati (nom. inval.)]|nr:hypothetical protein H8356DRAFT_1323428 [Neocallimastix sp. JGI-2020a]